MQQNQKLVLFDIDGTLVRMKSGLPQEIFREAMSELFDLSIDLEGFDFSGKTDYRIFREIGTLAGLKSETIEGHQELMMEYVANALGVRMNRESLHLLPGVESLLESLAANKDATTLAILTGNTPRGAEAKLAVYGLNPYFRFGVYGNETHDRNELGPLALKRASELTGVRFASKDVVIVGDTTRDADCARAIGAKCIITLTGKTKREEFDGSHSDIFFDNLSDTGSVLNAILSHEEVFSK